MILILYILALITLTLIILRYKEYKKSLSVLIISVYTIFVGPVVYYIILNGTSYKVFNNYDMRVFLILSSVTFISYSIAILIKMTYKINVKNSKYILNNDNRIVRIYFYTIIGITLLYFIIYADRFPLVQSIKYGTYSGERPDIEGYIPNYYTFATFTNYILPGIYFYYSRSIKNKSKFINFTCIFLLSITLVIGGNKSSLVYFYIFIWINEFGFKINTKVVLMGIISFLIYILLKNGQSHVWETVGSGIRRFFVTQGAMLIGRISMINEHYSFIFGNGETIQNQVYEYIYGGIGSAPTYFIGDMIIKNGYIIGIILHFIVIAFFVNLSRIVDLNFKENNFVKWNLFTILYFISMNSINSSSLIRISIIILNLIIVNFLSKLSNVKEKKCIRYY